MSSSCLLAPGSIDPQHDASLLRHVVHYRDRGWSRRPLASTLPAHRFPTARYGHRPARGSQTAGARLTYGADMLWSTVPPRSEVSRYDPRGGCAMDSETTGRTIPRRSLLKGTARGAA